MTQGAATMKQVNSQSWRLSLRTWVGLLALALTFWLIIKHAGLVLEVLWVFFGAILLSLAIRPLADRLAHWRIPHGITALVVYLLFGALLVLMAYLLAPLVRAEVAQLRTSGPDLVRTALSRLKTLPVIGSLLPSADTLTSDLTQRLDLLITTALGTVASIGGLLLDVLLVLVIACFFVVDSNVGQDLVTGWVPQDRQDGYGLLWTELAGA
jgi:predicted PurR-regulated permease PerM